MAAQVLNPTTHISVVGGPKVVLEAPRWQAISWQGSSNTAKKPLTRKGSPVSRTRSFDVNTHLKRTLVH